MKKLLFGLFIFVSCFVLISFGVKTKAVSTPTMTTGASIRHTGEHQGLKFSASVSSLDGVVEKGFYVALGEHSKDDIEDAVEASLDRIGGNKLIKKEVEGEDLDFHVVIYNIPEEKYGQKITALAYVYDGSSYTFADEARTRDIADIARGLYNTTTTYDEDNNQVYTVANACRIKVTHSDSSIAYYDEFSSFSFAAGDTVELIKGTYSETVSIDQSNIAIYGPNRDNDNFNSRSYEANFTVGFSIAKDLSNITIDGIKVSGSAAIVGNNLGGISNLTITNNYFGILSKTRNSLSGPLYFNNATSSKANGNFNISNNLFENTAIDTNAHTWTDTYASNHAETTIFVQDLEGLTYNNNTVKNFYNCIEVNDEGAIGEGLAGNVEINNNSFLSYAQFVLQIKTFDAETFSFENNTIDATNNAVGDDFAGVVRFYAEGSTAGKVINIKYNRFIECFGWHMIRFASFTKTTVNVTYNLFKSDKHSSSAITVVQNAGAASVVSMGWNCYLVSDGSGTSTAMSGNKGNVTTADGSSDFSTEEDLNAAIALLP